MLVHFNRKVDGVLGLIRNHVAMASSQETGRDLDHCKILIKKFVDFEKVIHSNNCNNTVNCDCVDVVGGVVQLYLIACSSSLSLLSTLAKTAFQKLQICAKMSHNHWRASEASEILSGVYKFELVRYVYIYICMEVRMS